jgi:hypothetical protein
MRAATIRRSLVFAVCALGVASLYLVPTPGSTSGELSSPTANDEPNWPPARPANPRPAALDEAPSGQADTAGADSADSVDRAQRRAGREPTSKSTRSPVAAPVKQGVPSGSSSRNPSRGATAYVPKDSREDDEPPQAVETITSSKVTALHLRLDWPAVRDNVKVVGYRVWLSGYLVADTTDTHATVRWFNDDTDQHVVQVKAVDAAGNEAETSPTLLVSRPDPDATATPTPADSTNSPEPTTQPSGSAASHPDASMSATADPSPVVTNSARQVR